MSALIDRSLGEFLKHSYPPKEDILAPWFQKRGTAMIAGWRGLGKTYVSLSIALAIPTGGNVLGWQASEPRKVLFVDGEMDPVDLQDRITAMLNAMQLDGNGDVAVAASNMRLLCFADQKAGIPDLADPAGLGRRYVEEMLTTNGSEVLILDNLSALCSGSGEADNDVASWLIMQAWLLKLRAAGISVILIHHTGKPNEKGVTKQRGTSKREDVLTASILLQPSQEKGTNFTVEFSKSRGFKRPEDFSVQIQHEKGECRVVRYNLAAMIAMLLAEGKTQEEAAAILGVDQSTVSRRKPRGGARACRRSMQKPRLVHNAA